MLFSCGRFSREMYYTLGLVHRSVLVPNCPPYRAMVWERKEGRVEGRNKRREERALEVAGNPCTCKTSGFVVVHMQHCNSCNSTQKKSRRPKRSAYSAASRSYGIVIAFQKLCVLQYMHVCVCSYVCECVCCCSA